MNTSMPIFLPRPIFRFIDRLDTLCVRSTDTGDFRVFEQQDGSLVRIQMEAYVMYLRQKQMGRCG